MAYNQEMSLQAQKIRDKQMREFRSFNCMDKNRIRRIKLVKSMIQDLENYGPAGLLHIAILSNIIGKNIKIWNADGSLNRIIGKEKVDDAVEVEYHPTNLEHIGHWTLRYGKDPDNINIDLNSCLFSVISSQTKQNPSNLRRWTVLKLKSNLQKFANLMDEIIRSKENDGIVLMVGGACYTGLTHRDAKIILDNSEGRRAHGLANRRGIGHARKHTSCNLPTLPISCVEQFSYKSYKTAFLSRREQDEWADYILKTPVAQRVMDHLNDEEVALKKVTINYPICLIDSESRCYLPRLALEFCNGRPISSGQLIRMLTIVLCHHENCVQPIMPVFVLTFYPQVEISKTYYFIEYFPWNSKYNNIKLDDCEKLSEIVKTWG